jgi:hypothetical protein
MAEDREKQFLQLDSKILSLKDTLIKEVNRAIKESVGEGDLDNYKIVWKQLQDIALPAIKKVLKENFKEAEFPSKEKKSVYPDLEMVWNRFKIAIDIKSSVSSKQPEYDIARLDTVLKKRIHEYDEEYELVIEYDDSTKRLKKMFFEHMRTTVGFSKKSEGVKFRLYDGKLRPKSWKEFEEGIIYWDTKAKFLEGIKASQRLRWRILIPMYVSELSEKDKREFKEFLLSLF